MVINVSGPFAETILGHKAEHLLTATENLQNLLLSPDIISEVEGNELLSYVRHYSFSQGSQVQSKYTVVVAYTEENLHDYYFPTERSPPEASCPSRSTLSPVVNLGYDKLAQLFTPCTKNALDSILASTITGTSQPTGAKRSLDFNVDVSAGNSPLVSKPGTHEKNSLSSLQLALSGVDSGIVTPSAQAADKMISFLMGQ